MKKNIWILRNEPIAATYCLLQISKKIWILWNEPIINIKQR